MNDLEFKMKYIKYKLKYLQLKQKEQSGGMDESSALGTPAPSSDLKFHVIPQVRGNTSEGFRYLVRDIITNSQHTNLELTIARFVSDVLHDMGDSSRKIRIENGKLPPDLDSKTLFQKHLFNNPTIIDTLNAGGYKFQNAEGLFKSIKGYHGDPQIGVLNTPTSKFSIQHFMNLELPRGYYLDVNIGEEPTSEDDVIGIIDKGSEGRGVQPGVIWADGNKWLLDGLKPIPNDLSSFRDSLSSKLKKILVQYDNNFFREMLKSIAQEYFNSILKYMFKVNQFYEDSLEHSNVLDISIELEESGNFSYWFLHFAIGDNNYKVNITGRGSSELTYDLRSLEVMVNDTDLPRALFLIDNYVSEKTIKIV